MSLRRGKKKKKKVVKICFSRLINQTASHVPVTFKRINDDVRERNSSCGKKAVNKYNSMLGNDI